MSTQPFEYSGTELELFEQARNWKTYNRGATLYLFFRQESSRSWRRSGGEYSNIMFFQAEFLALLGNQIKKNGPKTLRKENVTIMFLPAVL